MLWTCALKYCEVLQKPLPMPEVVVFQPRTRRSLSVRSDPFVGALVQSSKCTPVLLQSGRTARGGGFVVPVTQLVLHKP